MASPPESVQINAEEFSKEEKVIAGKFAGILNNFLLTTSEIFNKRLTFSENFSGDTPTVRVKGGEPITFKYQGPGTPRLLTIGQWRVVQGTHTPAAVSLPQWSFDGRGSITIQPVFGFTSGTVYDMVLTITTG